MEQTKVAMIRKEKGLTLNCKCGGGQMNLTIDEKMLLLRGLIEVKEKGLGRAININIDCLIKKIIEGDEIK